MMGRKEKQGEKMWEKGMMREKRKEDRGKVDEKR